MTRQAIIDKTIKLIKKLPDEKVMEVSNFADFILKQYEESLLTSGIQNLVEEGDAFEFLKKEENLYTEDDLKEMYEESHECTN